MADTFGAKQYGDSVARIVSGRVGGKVADATALAAIAPNVRKDGMLAIRMSDQTLWVFDEDSAAGASATVVVPDSGSGRWLAVVVAV